MVPWLWICPINDELWLEVPMILFEDIDCQRLLYVLTIYLLFEVVSYGWFYFGPIVIILGNACYNGEVSWNASY
jgi:hypothetical protein